MSAIKVLQGSHKFAVVFSGCICTGSHRVNERINIRNLWISNEYKKERFIFIDNSNIGSNGLVDFVRLNKHGDNSS